MNYEYPMKPGEIKTIPLAEVAAITMSIEPMTTDQSNLKRLIARRHPEYVGSVKHWKFLEDTYEGGRSWFKGNIFQYIKEGTQEFADRVERAYRFNHTREVVDLVNKYLFKQNIERSQNAPPSLVKFWKSSTRNGLPIKDFARQISKKTSIYGRIGVVVDNITRTGDVPVSKADEKIVGATTYAYIVSPEQMLDYAFDAFGALEWILIKECVRDDLDPLTSTGKEEERYRLWTKTEWRLFEEQKDRKGKITVVEIGNGTHNLGEVPVILADHTISDEEYCASAMIDDIAYLDKAVANYLSNLDAIIQDQTFSQLAMPAQNVLPGEDAYTKLLELGTKRIFLYDGEGNQKPFFLSPDPKQAELIVGVIQKIISEIYHTVGMAGERTKQDNALGIDNSSGVAKAYDFEKVNALLASKADSLERIENKIAYLVALWNGEEDKVVALDKDAVLYPDNFDTRGIYDEFDMAARLMLVMAPGSVRREQMSMLIDKLFPQLKKDLRTEIDGELKDWPLDPLAIDPATGQPTAPDQQSLQKTAGRDIAKATMAAT